MHDAASDPFANENNFSEYAIAYGVIAFLILLIGSLAFVMS